MKLAQLDFNFNSGEGSAKLSSQFLKSDWVTQADALQDWIVELQELYSKLLETHQPIRKQE